MSEPFLVFLIKPPPDVADELDFVRQKLGLYRGYSKDRLHATVQPLGYRRMLSDATISKARFAAESLVHPPFHVVFDRLNGGKLEGSEPIKGFLAFRASLQTELAKHMALRKHSTSPHITLVYRAAPASCQVDPISWLVEEFMLIESFQGEGRHEELGRWKLRF